MLQKNILASLDVLFQLNTWKRGTKRSYW